MQIKMVNVMIRTHLSDGEVSDHPIKVMFVPPTAESEADEYVRRQALVSKEVKDAVKHALTDPNVIVAKGDAVLYYPQHSVLRVEAVFVSIDSH